MNFLRSLTPVLVALAGASVCCAQGPLIYIAPDTLERFVYVLPDQTNDSRGLGEGIEDGSSVGVTPNSGSVKVLAGGTVPTQYWFTSELLFDRVIKLEEIASFEYKTKKPTAGNKPDWYVNVYTKPIEGQSPAGWYNARLTGEPYFSANLSAPADEWNAWSTDEGTNRLRFFDQTTGGSYTHPHWDSVLTSASSRSPSVTHGESELMFFSLNTGNPWYKEFDGQLDYVRIVLTDDTCVTVDFGPDRDGDGLADGLEIKLGTNIDAPDSDEDGLLDGLEYELGTDPLAVDTDGDGLDDGEEVERGTDPLVRDTDGDGFDDGIEVNLFGSDPLDPADPLDLSGDATVEQALAFEAAELVLEIGNIDLGLFTLDEAGVVQTAAVQSAPNVKLAPNRKAAEGRRTSLANRLSAVSRAASTGDYESAISALESAMAKVDDAPDGEPDWIAPSEAKSALFGELNSLLLLLQYFSS
jgi:hypothetical protein